MSKKNSKTTSIKTSKTNWAHVDALPDNEIDYSDMPETAEVNWANAVVHIAEKKGVFLRLDTDIIEWFKSQGSRYQTRINQVLRSYKEAHTPKRKSAST